MKILVTGARGMLGSDVMLAAENAIVLPSWQDGLTAFLAQKAATSEIEAEGGSAQ